MGRGEGAMDKAHVAYAPINKMCTPHGTPNLLTSAADDSWKAIRKAVAVSFSMQVRGVSCVLCAVCCARLCVCVCVCMPADADVCARAGAAAVARACCCTPRRVRSQRFQCAHPRARTQQNIKKKFPLVLSRVNQLVDRIAAQGPAASVDVDQAALRVTLDVIGLVRAACVGMCVCVRMRGGRRDRTASCALSMHGTRSRTLLPRGLTPARALMTTTNAQQAGFKHDYNSVSQDVPPYDHLLRVLPRCFTEVMLRVANPLRPLVPGLFKTGPKGSAAFVAFQKEMGRLLDEIQVRPVRWQARVCCVCACLRVVRLWVLVRQATRGA
jgi:hypothetical protein